MNTKKIPAIISLAAGLVSLIVTYISKEELLSVLTTLFIVLLSFYILGCILKVIIDKLTAEKEPEEEEEKELENIDTENGQNADESETDA